MVDEHLSEEGDGRPAYHPPSDEVMKRLVDLFQNVYPVSRDALIYSEIVTGESNFRGITELRDVLEHLSCALLNDEDDDEYAMENLTEAYEHLRRAGVESLQKAAVKLFDECLECIKKPPILFKLAFVEVPDTHKVRSLRMEAMKKITNGRQNKSNRDLWMTAMEDFMGAIDCCHELQDLYPPKAEIRFRIVALFSVMITLLSFVFAIYVWWASQTQTI